MDNFFNRNTFEAKEESIASPEEIESFGDFLGPKLKEVSEQIDNIKALEEKGTSEKVKEALVSAKKAVGRVIKFSFTRLLPAYMAYIGAGHVLQKEDGKFSEKDRAQKELEERGITSEQASAYKLGMSDLLYRGVTPIWSTSGLKSDDWTRQAHLIGLVIKKDIIPNLLGDSKIKLAKDEEIVVAGEKRKKGDLIESSSDAWRLYLGLPQENNTFGISQYQPNKSVDDKFYFKVNKYAESLKKSILMKNKIQDGSSYGAALLDFVNEINKEGGSVVTQGLGEKKISSHESEEIINMDERDLLLVFGTYTVSVGEDERGSFISYYDKWDFAIATEESGKGFGRAFEIYDRIYYNPETGEIIDELLSK